MSGDTSSPSLAQPCCLVMSGVPLKSGGLTTRMTIRSWSARRWCWTFSPCGGDPFPVSEASSRCRLPDSCQALVCGWRVQGRRSAERAPCHDKVVIWGSADGFQRDGSSVGRTSRAGRICHDRPRQWLPVSSWLRERWKLGWGYDHSRAPVHASVPRRSGRVGARDASGSAAVLDHAAWAAGGYRRCDLGGLDDPGWRASHWRRNRAASSPCLGISGMAFASWATREVRSGTD